MAEVTLRVTSGVLSHTSGGREDQRQIALTAPSGDIAPAIAAITGRQPRTLILGGTIQLILADRSAIWRSHNQTHIEDFDALFDFLAHRPDREVRFLCQLVPV